MKQGRTIAPLLCFYLLSYYLKTACPCVTKFPVSLYLQAFLT